MAAYKLMALRIPHTTGSDTKPAVPLSAPAALAVRFDVLVIEIARRKQRGEPLRVPVPYGPGCRLVRLRQSMSHGVEILPREGAMAIWLYKTPTYYF